MHTSPSRHIAQAILYGTHAATVVADVVLEVLPLLRHRATDQLAHRALVAFEHGVERGVEHVVAEALRDLQTAQRCSTQRGDDRVEVREIPVRQAAVVQDDAQHVLLQLAALVDLHRRHADTFLVDLSRIGRQAARHFAADVGHVTEHRRPREQGGLRGRSA
jgi:hypothetical protein